MLTIKYFFIGLFTLICIIFLIQFLSKRTSKIEEPKYIYKILTKDEWSNMQNKSVLLGSEMDIKDGFIHLSTAKQTQRIANKYFPNMSDGYILKILYKDIKSKTKWEANSKGELFAHCYDGIPIELIVDIYPLSVKEFDFKKLVY